MQPKVCPDCEDILPEDGSKRFQGDCGYTFCKECLNSHVDDCECKYVNVDKEGRKIK